MWTEATILDAAEEHFGQWEPCLMLRQVETVGDDMRARRLDGVVITESWLRIAVEAKVTASDYRRETDSKRSASWRFAHECWYAAPEGLIDPLTLPQGWGLLSVREGGAVAVRRPMGHKPVLPAADHIIGPVLWRAAAVERRLRHPQDPDERAAALALDVERLQGVVAERDAAVAREKARAQHAAEQVLALVGPQTCSTCYASIVYTRIGQWRHEDPACNAGCEAARAEAERKRRMAATGAFYVKVPAPRIMPIGLSADC